MNCRKLSLVIHIVTMCKIIKSNINESAIFHNLDCHHTYLFVYYIEEKFLGTCRYVQFSPTN